MLKLESISSKYVRKDEKASIFLLNAGDEGKQMFGSVTDLQIWNKSLSKEEVNKWSTCEINSKGNVFNWDFMAKGNHRNLPTIDDSI